MSYIIDGTLALLIVISIYTDLRERKILNVVVIPAIIAGLALNAFAQGMTGLMAGLKGAGLGFLLLLIPFMLGGFGAGDVKLLTAVGALQGSGFVFVVFLGAGIAGGVLAVVVLVKQGRFMAAVKRIGTNIFMLFAGAGRNNAIKNLDQAEYHESLPYAIPIGIGCLLAYIVR